MASKADKVRGRIGRPPAGARAGEKVKDYPQLSIRVPAETKLKVQAMSLVKAQPQWRLISDAIEKYFRQQPQEDRRLVEELLRRPRARWAATRRTS
jgi:predicted DNA-binding protein